MKLIDTEQKPLETADRLERTAVVLHGALLRQPEAPAILVDREIVAAVVDTFHMLSAWIRPRRYPMPAAADE